MPAKIVVPELGESVLEATVGRWLKNEGERVMVGEPLVELETEKVDLEVGAEKAGVLARIERKQGEDVKIGDVLGTIEEAASAETPSGPRQAEAGPGYGSAETAAAEETIPSDGKKAAPSSVSKPSPAPVEATQTPAPAEAPSGASPTSSPTEQSMQERSTPSARRRAREQGLEVAQVPSRDASGRVTAEDVQKYLREKGDAAGRNDRDVAAGLSGTGPPASGAGPKPRMPAEPVREPPVQKPHVAVTPGERREERVRMSRRRQTIARRLVEAQHTAAMLTTFNEVDMSGVMDLRKRQRESFKQRHGVGLGIVSFFAKASIAALRQFPRINAEIQGDEMVLKYYYDIGIAVGASGGLVVPVLRDADRMSFAEIEAAIKDFARKSEDGTLSPEDLKGGTFTITNGGVFGSLLSTPILNPPQVGILGLHKIQERPVTFEGQLVSRPMMYVALSYDHRIVDGAEAVQFLARVKELVEDPGTLLLEG